MIKVRAFFSDGSSEGFVTNLPLKEEIINKLNNGYYGMDRVTLESDLPSNKIEVLQDYVNESYDLIAMDIFSTECGIWTELELDQHIEHISNTTTEGAAAMNEAISKSEIGKLSNYINTGHERIFCNPKDEERLTKEFPQLTFTVTNYVESNKVLLAKDSD